MDTPHVIVPANSTYIIWCSQRRRKSTPMCLTVTIALLNRCKPFWLYRQYHFIKPEVTSLSVAQLCNKSIVLIVYIEYMTRKCTRVYSQGLVPSMHMPCHATQSPNRCHIGMSGPQTLRQTHPPCPLSGTSGDTHSQPRSLCCHHHVWPDQAACQRLPRR